VQVFSHLLLENTPADFDGRRYLTKIVRETNRCRDIVRSLLDFSRPARESCRPADLNAIVHATLDLLAGHAVLMNVEIVLDLSPATLDIVCDSSQIQQAFTNIVINAAEAIHDTGKIEIRSWKEAPPNSMVAVSFADTGCGIPPENLEHIFDPFFTTKEEGHSTGLGLAVVYGIVERHGGTMNVDSSPGRGTTFTLRLPERETEEGSP